MNCISALDEVKRSDLLHDTPRQGTTCVNRQRGGPQQPGKESAGKRTRATRAERREQKRRNNQPNRRRQHHPTLILVVRLKRRKYKLPPLQSRSRRRRLRARTTNEAIQREIKTARVELGKRPTNQPARPPRRGTAAASPTSFGT